MTLYHYTTGQGLSGILEKSELHCSHVNFMNDPSEESYFVNVIKSVIDASETAKKIYTGLFAQSYIDSASSPYGKFIASFSKNKDSLSMWNYYAQGNGYNLGVDIDKIIESNENNTDISIKKLELLYDRKLQEQKILDCLLSFQDDFELHSSLEESRQHAIQVHNEDKYYEATADQVYIETSLSSTIVELGLSFKHQAYEREEEVRLIISSKNWNKNINDFKVSGNGVFIQYLPLGFNIETCLKSITIHPLNGPLHLDGTKRFMANKFPKHKIQIETTSIPFRIV